jgi:hypothetical protein
VTYKDINVYVCIIDIPRMIDVFTDEEYAKAWAHDHHAMVYYRSITINEPDPEPPDQFNASYGTVEDISPQQTTEIHDEPENYELAEKSEGNRLDDILWCLKCGTLVRRDFVFRHNQHHQNILQYVGSRMVE